MTDDIIGDVHIEKCGQKCNKEVLTSRSVIQIRIALCLGVSGNFRKVGRLTSDILRLF